MKMSHVKNGKLCPFEKGDCTKYTQLSPVYITSRISLLHFFLCSSSFSYWIRSEDPRPTTSFGCPRFVAALLIFYTHLYNTFTVPLRSKNCCSDIIYHKLINHTLSKQFPAGYLHISPLRNQIAAVKLVLILLSQNFHSYGNYVFYYKAG